MNVIACIMWVFLWWNLVSALNMLYFLKVDLNFRFLAFFHLFKIFALFFIFLLFYNVISLSIHLLIMQMRSALLNWLLFFFKSGELFRILVFQPFPLTFELTVDFVGNWNGRRVYWKCRDCLILIVCWALFIALGVLCHESRLEKHVSQTPLIHHILLILMNN